MFCSKCGTKLMDGMAFCPKCGAKVILADEPVEATAQPNPAVQSQPSAQQKPTVQSQPSAQPNPAVQSQPSAQREDSAAPKKKSLIPIIAAALAIFILVGAAGMLLYLKSPSTLYKQAMSKADAFMDDKDYKNAIAGYLDALKYGKSTEDTEEALYNAYVKYAKKLEKDEDYEEAAEQYELALELNKKAKNPLIEVYLKLARQLYDDGKTEEAISYAKKILKIDQENDQARNLINRTGGASSGEAEATPATSEAGSSPFWEVPAERDPGQAASGEAPAESNPGQTASGNIPVEANAPAISETPAAEVRKYPVYTDANGNKYDLGGMEIIIRDWWSPEEAAAPRNEYEEELLQYRQWIQETYNFKIRQVKVSDWDSAPQDFVDYVCSCGDDANYAFILRNDPATLMAMRDGMCVSLNELDCLDFSAPKFTQNLVHKQYAMRGKIYAMAAGNAEPGIGIFFNKRILLDAGIDPDDLYEMQKNGTWTWEAFLDLCNTVQRDVNNDGIIDVWAADANNPLLTEAAVYSNGGEFIGMDNAGNYVYKLEDPNTLEGIDFAKKIFDNYWADKPDSGWDYYQDAFINGKCAFVIDQAYAGQSNGFLSQMEDEWGFVMFPKGPRATDYTNVWAANPVCIPGCYDIERAWKIAFAWNLYTDEVPGYEGDSEWKKSAYETFSDKRAVDETLAMMREKGKVTYHTMILNLDLGSQFTWQIGPGTGTVSEVVNSAANLWKTYVDEANRKK